VLPGLVFLFHVAQLTRNFVISSMDHFVNVVNIHELVQLINPLGETTLSGSGAVEKSGRNPKQKGCTQEAAAAHGRAGQCCSRQHTHHAFTFTNPLETIARYLVVERSSVYCNLRHFSNPPVRARTPT